MLSLKVVPRFQINYEMYREMPPGHSTQRQYFLYHDQLEREGILRPCSCNNGVFA